jgi:hypothetical protein
MPLPIYPALDNRFAVEDLHEDLTSVIAVVRPRECSARCPQCHQPSVQVQSRYVRRIHDLPITGKMVQLDVHTRRFHCHTATCPQRIFSEQFTGLAERSARRTVRLRATLRQIGFAVGGEVGARLARSLGIAVSPTTLLRLVRTASMPIATPRILGVDDFGATRGCRGSCMTFEKEESYLEFCLQYPTRLNQVRLGQCSRIPWWDGQGNVRPLGDCEHHAVRS